MTLLEKLGQIQTKLKAPKNLYNKFGKYNYRNAEGIQEAVKPYIKEYRVVLTLEDHIILIGDRFYVEATARLYDQDSDEQVLITAQAREQESKAGMDSAQITGSTSSYARKYALNGLFLLDDTKDPDTEELKEESEAKAKKATEKTPDAAEGIKRDLIQLAFKAGVSTQQICDQAGVNDLKEIDPKTYAQIKTALLKKIGDPNGDPGKA